MLQTPPTTDEYLPEDVFLKPPTITDEEFDKLKQVEYNKVITESRLDNTEVGIVFAPRPKEAWPEMMKTLRLWK